MSPSRQTFSTGKGEDVINHFGAVRMRVQGSGNLKMKLWSLGDAFQTILAPVPIQPAMAVEPNRLANFTQFRARLEIRTTEINEVFTISKIIIFVKPVAKSFPEVT